MPAKYITTAAVVAILLVAGLAAVDAGVAESGDEIDVVNESFVPPASAGVVSLNQSDLSGVRYAAADELTVEDENGTQMVQGSDFAWNRTNGSLEVLAGSRLLGDSIATIDYGLRVTSSEQSNISDTVANSGEAARLIPMVLVVGFVVLGLRAFLETT
jgi:hypothetical protein